MKEIRPVYFNFDQSLSIPPGIAKIPLEEWQDSIRYHCQWKKFHELEAMLAPEIPKYNFYFLGHGDFHHLTYLIIKNIKISNLNVVVFDNHCDNMFLPVGIHCASWVSHVAKLDHVSKVIIYGMNSNDLNGINLFQNNFKLMRAHKIYYRTLRNIPKCAKFLSGNAINLISKQKDSLLEKIKNDMAQFDGPIYLSIDKDVLSKEELLTGWDQGQLSTATILQSINSLKSKIIAADVVGDLSFYRFNSLFKNLFRVLDGTNDIPRNKTFEDKRQLIVNESILRILSN